MGIFTLWLLLVWVTDDDVKVVDVLATRQACEKRLVEQRPEGDPRNDMSCLGMSYDQEVPHQKLENFLVKKML